MVQEKPAILVVDDERTIRQILSGYLETVGYPVFTADGGEEALSILKEREIRFVLLDIRMPDMDGFQVLQRIRLLDPSIIVIMISGVGMENLAQLALRMGASDYISKPFNFEYLETVISMLEVLNA